MPEAYVTKEYIDEQLENGASVEYLKTIEGFDYFAIYQKGFPQEYIVYTDENYEAIWGVKY